MLCVARDSHRTLSKALQTQRCLQWKIHEPKCWPWAPYCQIQAPVWPYGLIADFCCYLRNGSHKQHKTVDFYRDECPTQVSVILSTKFSNPPCKDRAASINPQVGAGQATERLHILENCGHGANMTTCHTMGGHSNGTIWSQNIPGQTWRARYIANMQLFCHP